MILIWFFYIILLKGGVNYEICTAKDNGFSLMTDKGYVSVNSEGQIYHCKTIDNAGNEKRFNVNA